MLSYPVLQRVSLARGQKRRWLPKHQCLPNSDLLPELMQQLSCYVMTSTAIQLIKSNTGKNVLSFFIFLLSTCWISLKRERCDQGTSTHKRCYEGQMVLSLPCICNGELSKLVTLGRKKCWFRHIVQIRKRHCKLSKQVEYPIRHFQNGESLGFSFIVTSNL